VGLFRRRNETLNEQLLREAGFDPTGMPKAAVHDEPAAESTEAAPPFAESEVFPPIAGYRPAVFARGGYAERPGVWDVLTTAEDDALRRDEYAFATLPDGSLIVDEDCDEDLSRLADAAEKEIAPPYEAQATRRADGGWSVAANAIDVVELPDEPGDNVTLSRLGGELSYVRDGEDVDARDAPQPLIDLGRECGEDFVVEATRLDGVQFDATARPL
jgi:hypothetical protein